MAPTAASRVNWLDLRAHEYPRKRPLPARSMGSSDATTRTASSGLSRCPAIPSALSSARTTDVSSRPGQYRTEVALFRSMTPPSFREIRQPWRGGSNEPIRDVRDDPGAHLGADRTQRDTVPPPLLD